jgi:hypothetical protein
VKPHISNDKLSVGAAVFHCLMLGACGGIVGGAVFAVALYRTLAGVPCGLVVAFPGALVGATLGAPVAAATDRRLGWFVAASAGVLCGAAMIWMLLEALSGLGGG